MNNTPPEQAPRASSRRWMGILTLVILLAIVIGFWRYSENLIGSLEYQAASIREKNEVLAIIASPHARLIPLKAPADSGSAFGKLIFDSGSGDAVIYVRGLFPTAGAERYCLWLAGRAETTRVAEFSFTDTTLQRGEWYFGTLNPAEWERGVWRVTLEPRGNQPAPSGRVVLSAQTDESGSLRRTREPDGSPR
ncbi:MAG: anti-sigma factor [Ignavibacterium sp.]